MRIAGLSGGMPDVPGLLDNPGLPDVPENLVLPKESLQLLVGLASPLLYGALMIDGLWLLTGCPPVCFCSVGVTLGF